MLIRIPPPETTPKHDTPIRQRARQHAQRAIKQPIRIRRERLPRRRRIARPGGPVAVPNRVHGGREAGDGGVEAGAEIREIVLQGLQLLAVPGRPEDADGVAGGGALEEEAFEVVDPCGDPNEVAGAVEDPAEEGIVFLALGGEG